MNAKAFITSYILHDSIIDKIEIVDSGCSIVMWVDFAFWMQNGYNEYDPETGVLKITFSNVSAYVIPGEVEWNAISILDARAVGDNIIFSLMNDMTDEYMEISINSDNVTVEPMPVNE